MYFTLSTDLISHLDKRLRMWKTYRGPKHEQGFTAQQDRDAFTNALSCQDQGGLTFWVREDTARDLLVPPKSRWEGKVTFGPQKTFPMT